MSPKIRPIPAVPMICSPHVFLSSEALRLMASMGPTPSTTSTGTTRNVMTFQANPPSAATMAPANPPRSRSACSSRPTVAAMAAQPSTDPMWLQAPRRPSPSVGSPPLRRTSAALTSAALKNTMTKYCTR